jgi:hypothetical protein
MIGFRSMGIRVGSGLEAAGLVLVLVGLAACSASNILGGTTDPAPAATPAPVQAAAPAPPPVDLAGRWQLAAASGGACMMNFADATTAAANETTAAAPSDSGTIAPEGGCPGSFFTSRRWSFENGVLIIRDFKGRQLAQLSYVGGHFEGQDKGGGALTLSKQI